MFSKETDSWELAVHLREDIFQYVCKGEELRNSHAPRWLIIHMNIVNLFFFLSSSSFSQRQKASLLEKG